MSAQTRRWICVGFSISNHQRQQQEQKSVRTTETFLHSSTGSARNSPAGMPLIIAIFVQVREHCRHTQPSSMAAHNSHNNLFTLRSTARSNQIRCRSAYRHRFAYRFISSAFFFAAATAAAVGLGSVVSEMWKRQDSPLCDKVQQVMFALTLMAISRSYPFR